MKTIHDFSASERAVIRDRRRYQSNAELAAVFGCHANTIAAIVRTA